LERTIRSRRFIAYDNRKGHHLHRDVREGKYDDHEQGCDYDFCHGNGYWSGGCEIRTMWRYRIHWFDSLCGREHLHLFQCVLLAVFVKKMGMRCKPAFAAVPQKRRKWAWRFIECTFVRRKDAERMRLCSFELWSGDLVCFLYILNSNFLRQRCAPYQGLRP
jgi:hypothetical protein